MDDAAQIVHEFIDSTDAAKFAACSWVCKISVFTEDVFDRTLKTQKNCRASGSVDFAYPEQTTAVEAALGGKTDQVSDNVEVMTLVVVRCVFPKRRLLGNTCVSNMPIL